MNAAAYARYSTANQTENSIEYQLAKIRAFCLEKGITLTAVFTDEAKSGTNTDRPGFRAMLEAAKRREFAAVVIYDITRGSRDVGDWFTFRKEMLLLGVQVISATQNLGDLSNGNDFLLELLSVGLGHREVLETRQKSMDGVDVRARKGAFLGGMAPLGYKIVKSAYVIDEEEARAVRTIFQMYAEGRSYGEIIEKLDGITGRRGAKLNHGTLLGILRNERYIGVYTWNKREWRRFGKWVGGSKNPRAVRIEGSIPAIIDMETWERVQKRMGNAKRNAANTAKREYLLSGLIECEACGGAFVGRFSRNSRGYETRYYCCGRKYRAHTCHSPNINAAAIEGFVADQLKAYLESADIPAEAARIAEKANAATPDLKAEKAELAQVSAKISRGVKALLGGWADVPELREEVERLRGRKLELEDLIRRQGMERPPVTAEDVEQIFRYGLEHWDDNLKQVIQMHVRKICVHVDGTISVHVGVDTGGCGSASRPPECQPSEAYRLTGSPPVRGSP